MGCACIQKSICRSKDNYFQTYVSISADSGDDDVIKFYDILILLLLIIILMCCGGVLP